MPLAMGQITHLLPEWRTGSRDAGNRLFELVLPNLRRLAHYLVKGERKDHSLEPIELIDQTYILLVTAKGPGFWQNRQHFYAIPARTMRRYLIDHAGGRPNGRVCGTGGVEELLLAGSPRVNLALTVDRLLNELAEVQPD
jgi:hypothetical protein